MRTKQAIVVKRPERGELVDTEPKESLNLTPKGYKRDLKKLPIVGRPPKLTKQTLKKIVTFFKEFEPYYELPLETQLANGTVKTEMKRVPNGIPNPGKLAKYI